jgi:hypothetical protein
MNSKQDVPDILYRGFRDLEHARAFVNDGVIRFGRLDHYRTIEDASRQDTDEGTAVLCALAPDSQDLIPEHWEGLNRVYILSCSAAEPGLVASKFGCHLVRINQPRALIDDIRRYASSHSLIPNQEVYSSWVSYDRGASVPTSPDIDEWLRLAYSQKSVSFTGEQEYRVALVSMRSYEHPSAEPTAAAVFIRLNGPLAYCDLLPNWAAQPTACAVGKQVKATGELGARRS